jgi:hypothetical protein
MGSMLKKLLAVGAVPSLGIALALPSPIAASGAAAPARAAATRAMAMPSAAGPRTRVIVMLRDQESGLAPRTAVRGNALRAEEGPLAATLRAAGATVEGTGSAIPYIVASVTSAQRTALAANPLVQLVVPDVVIPYPTPEITPEAIAPAPAAPAPAPPTPPRPRSAAPPSAPRSTPRRSPPAPSTRSRPTSSATTGPA